VEAAQTIEEVLAIPKLVKGPCLLNLVWKGKTPDIGFDEAERAGYKLAILPGMLFKAVLGVCDATLKQVRETRRHPKLDFDLPPRAAFRRVGADEWDAISEQFRPDARPKAAE
jgi:2-methylisocitrate lyase-like PEP mutase family enzyme